MLPSKLPETYSMIDDYLITTGLLRFETEKTDRDETTISIYKNRIEKLEMQLLEKADNIRHVQSRMQRIIEMINSEVNYHKTQVEVLKQKQSRLEAGFDGLKEKIIDIIKTTGEKNASGNYNIKTELGSFTVVKRVSDVEITNEESIPNNFIKIIQEKKIDKRGLLKYIKEVGEVDGDLMVTNCATAKIKEGLTIR